MIRLLFAAAVSLGATAVSAQDIPMPPHGPYPGPGTFCAPFKLCQPVPVTRTAGN